ncbi:MAG: type II toxin-antitoxin system Phd/YefM family antitoxin [Desulfuromonadales bacterium]
MRIITATELARNLRQVLDRLTTEPEEIIIERNNRQIGRLLPGPGSMTALEAMADLYRTLPEAAGHDWFRDSRKTNLAETLAAESRDPWDS